MDYEGPARLGEDDTGPEVWVRIVDVEDPNWVGSLPDARDHDTVPAREVAITLTGGGVYAGWSGTTRLTRSNSRLLGCACFVPPVGA